jgi:hypothetical protein
MKYEYKLHLQLLTSFTMCTGFSRGPKALKEKKSHKMITQ